MEKFSPSDGSRELQCVGRLEVVRPKPVGFLCGSIPVPTDKSFHDFNSALVPSHQTVSAPRYRMLPMETDLNMLPHLPSLDKVLPISAVQPKAAGGGAIAPNLAKKCEALAVSGLVEYGDELDVIAPTDILKQIFKIPYSKARLSIAVHRIGQTLILNNGADVEEGEKLVRRHNHQTKCADQSLFLNFAMHSVRMEACDCPPTHDVPSGRQSTSSLPGEVTSQFMGRHDDVAQNEGFKSCSEYTQVKKDGLLWGSKKNKRNKGSEPVKSSSHVETPRYMVQDSEKHRKTSSDGFLRVLFWQFHNFRMLLGSDLLLFSNEKYVAVSLHLWDVTQQVTPLTWLEAWLDNVMASVPELAICYHENGVVQGYELIKTDDIFLLKGISEDGTPAFHPNVVQQNGLSVLRFLQQNCKQDPGAYWLYKSSGDDVIQLFDLSIIPKHHSSKDYDDSSSSLPSLMHRGRSDSLFSLGTLLYRTAHRLSLSMTPNNRTKCARFIKKCLEFLDQPDHLVVRAFAHEQFARLILNHDEELDLISEPLIIESKIAVTDAEEESLDFLSSISESVVQEDISSQVTKDKPDEYGKLSENLEAEASADTTESNTFAFTRFIAPVDTEMRDPAPIPSASSNENLAVCEMSPTPANVVQTADPISSRLAAIHHVSQAIKSLRWMRQLQNTEQDLINQGSKRHDKQNHNISLCACGDVDCIEVCDIREWLPTSKLDHKLWKLVLLLGESYLALGEAYKEDSQLHQALKVVELACSVYGSMPQHLEENKFISSMTSCSIPQTKIIDKGEKTKISGVKEVHLSCNNDYLVLEQYSSTYLFWAKAWTLVGDVYVEYHTIKVGEDLSVQSERKPVTRELKMSSEVVKEVKRLKKKLGQTKENCRSCSLVNCSCQSDRASSGSSASSSSADTHGVAYGRKHGKRSYGKSAPYSLLEDPEDDRNHHKLENRKRFDSGYLQPKRGGEALKETFDRLGDKTELTSEATNSTMTEDALEMLDVGSALASATEITSRETPKVKNGGIFKYLGGPVVGEAENNLLAALSCYKEARNALVGLPTGSVELQSVIKKEGWVCNELGRNRLERKELNKAEVAFSDAINAFRQVSDHTNIILINCNLGHGRRGLAELMVSKLEELKVHAILHNVYNHTLETAKVEYRESLRFYGAAKSELNVTAEEGISVSESLRNEVYTQFAHTYLRLGMLLAREDTTAEVYENASLEEMSVGHISRSDRKTRKELRKHEISANEAIREALSMYESLGELRSQEAAYAYFQLACYQRDCCLRFSESDCKKTNLSKGETSIFQRVKQYASLADRNWQKAMDFYVPKTHPTMYLTILIERSALSLSLAGLLHSNAMLESALSRLLEGRNASGTITNSSDIDLHAKFWSQLQRLLKQMLSATLSANPSRSSPISQGTSSSNRSADAGKLKELYKMSLKSTDFGQLPAMHTLWTS